MPIFDFNNDKNKPALDGILLIIPSEKLSEHQERVAFLQSRLLYHLAYLQINKSICVEKRKEIQKEKQKIEDMKGLVFISHREVDCLPADSVAFSLIMSSKPTEESHCRGSLIKE